MKAKIILPVILLLVAHLAQAQNYKAPKIDASGRIIDKEGKYLGTVTSEGLISNAEGIKIAHVDSGGSLVDSKTGKKLGKIVKNGNLVSFFPASSHEKWTTNPAMNGICIVKDKDGNVKAEVHENYKQFGAGAVHCLSNFIDHHEALNGKKNADATYVCPMHPEVISEKPGRCSKCGMDLVKK